MKGPTHLLIVVVVGPFRPRRAAELTLAATVPTQWMANLLGTVLGSAIIGAGFFCGNVSTNAPVLRPVLQVPTGAQAIAFVGLSVACGVAGVYFVALSFLVFAYRDEPLRDTWRHAVRTIRLFSPVWMVLAGLYVAPVLYAFRGNGTPVWFALMICSSVAVLPVWGAYILGCALGVNRPGPAEPHNPLCEECGYLLLHLPPEARCPECGEPISRSLDEGRRWYPPLVNSVCAPVRGAIHSPAIQAWTQPRELFTQTCLVGDGSWLVRQAVRNFGLTAGMLFTIVFLGTFAVEGGDVPPAGAYIVACACWAWSAGGFCLWCLGASVVGVIASRLYGRNLLRAAFCVAAYSSGYFLFWALIAVLSLLVFRCVLILGVPLAPYWLVLAWLCLNVAMASGYVVAVWRRMRYVRFANWNLRQGAASPQDAEAADVVVPWPRNRSG